MDNNQGSGALRPEHEGRRERYKESLADMTSQEYYERQEELREMFTPEFYRDNIRDNELFREVAQAIIRGRSPVDIIKKLIEMNIEQAKFIKKLRCK